MSIVWTDPRTEQQMQTLREVTTRLLVETNPKKVDALLEQLTELVRIQLRTRPPD